MNSIKKGIVYIKERGTKAFLAGVVYFAVSRKNKGIEKIKYSLARTIKRKQRYIKVNVGGNMMLIDTKDKGICRELYVNKKREHFSTDYIKGFIKENDIIIDIGANIGYYVLLEAKLATKGKIFAIEPVPTNMDLLKKNIELNEYTNIKVFEEAIGDKIGSSKMYIYDKGNWCSFSDNLSGKIIGTKDVKLNTLDNFIKENLNGKFPNLLRMDVEGYEYYIFKGMKDLIISKKPLKIFIEIHTPQLNLTTPEKLNEIIETMKKNNFKIRAIFLEPEPANYKSVKFTNKLSKIINIPTLGPQEASYEFLEKLLKSKDLNCQPMVFFERD